MNVLYISHCDFTGNSAMHIFSVAEALRAQGVDSVVCVPNDPLTVYAHSEPPFSILHHDEVARWGAIFPNGRGPDLIHTWTPREFIRVLTEKLARRYDCPYIVHLEDNEQAILADEIGKDAYETLSRFSAPVVGELISPYRSHPQRSQTFISGAAGVTALMDRLLEFKPDHVPGVVFWPGFDRRFLAPGRRAAELRSELGLAAEDIAVVYNGNIHHSNKWEVTSLILAVRILSRRGVKLKLIKTGWNYAAESVVRQAQEEGYLIDLGFVDRDVVPALLSTADILVQPGRSNEFNDYRFPSKLPEFLVSGKPVILPRSNIGRYLQDGVNCLLLDKGDAFEIASRLEELIENPDLQRCIGAAGRDFAMTHLQWQKNVEPLFEFYSKVLSAPAKATVSKPKPVPSVDSDLPAKLIAFYLPQFHPIPENDEWWGEGFTEWTNVTSAKPFFPGHHQPQLPANLGFYDLRVPEVMQKQAEMAAKHGIYGFCLYYYWFNGKKLLDLPLNQMLSSGKPDFPFCLCWANENWTRAWDGAEKEILMEQVYSADADERFIRELIPIFRDPRYIRVGSAPLLLVYRVTALPNPTDTADLWRKICAEEGIPEIHLAAVQSFGFQDPAPFGFDSAVEFPPHVTHDLLPHEIVPNLSPEFDGYLEDYVQLARQQIQLPKTDYIRYRGVMPAWDNTARRGNKAHIVIRSTPELYEKWLRVAVDLTLLESRQAPLVFINAWNEWAEGAHLEPDQKYGMAHLEATRRGLCSGTVNFFSRLRLQVSEAAIENIIDSAYADRFAPGKNSCVVSKMKKTENWFDDSRLEEIAKRYTGSFPVSSLSYATVSDYCDSFDYLNPLATSNGDLKDVQRPWILKAILGRVPKGGRLLEIGAGEPFVADLLTRLGYEVWVVDPYDGSGNGPLEYERFSAQCPDVRFIRSRFGDQLLQLPERSLDCVYSISVLEHIPPDGLQSVAAGMKKFLKKEGLSIHAVDHVHRGNGAAEHLANLELMVDLFGLSRKDLSHQLERVNQDPDTYFLSAESHNRWRGSTPYREFPMRVCISVQLISSASAIQAPQKSKDNAITSLYRKAFAG